MMLELAGDGDPADLQAATGEQVHAILDEVGPALRQSPAEGEWSVLELLGHLVDAELIMSARYRWVIAEDEPEIVAYDQDLWVSRLRHNDGDPAALLATFQAVRDANLALWRSPATLRRRWGTHNERGQESFEMMFRMTAGHSIFHVEQMRRTMAALPGH